LHRSYLCKKTPVMKHKNKKITMVLAGLFSAALISGCGKDDTTPGPGGSSEPNFKPSDFQVTVYDATFDDNSYDFDYDVKNLKDKAYGNNYEDGDYWIRFTIKTTDGAQYQEEDYIEEIEAGGVSAQNGYINFTAGKTPDIATFKYEVYLND